MGSVQLGSFVFCLVCRLHWDSPVFFRVERMISVQVGVVVVSWQGFCRMNKFTNTRNDGNSKWLKLVLIIHLR